MAKYLKTVRNNWKKSVFAAGLLAYGSDFGYTQYQKNLLMRTYCEKAVQFGDTPVDIFQSPRQVFVILNPASNKKKAKKEYEKYCAPLLHLSGASVTLLTTSEKSDAVSLVRNVPESADALIIAGGDGTVSDVVTGLLRRLTSEPTRKPIPIGIIPLGKRNSLANELYSDEETLNDKMKRFKIMLNATYSIVNDVTKKISAMELENIDANDGGQKFAPVYAVHRLQVGAFRDADSKVDKYWYFGGLRSYASYLLGTYDRDGPVKVELKYTPPCSGCRKCFNSRLDLLLCKAEEPKRRWWHVFVPRANYSPATPATDYSKIENETCKTFTDMCLDTIELNVFPQIMNNEPVLRLQIGPKKMSFLDFVKEGWLRQNDDKVIASENVNIQRIDAETVFLSPIEDVTKKELWLSIDNEEYEFKRIRIALLHNILSVFNLPKSDVVKF